MTRPFFCFTLPLLVCLTSEAVAQDKKENKWTTGFPKTSTFFTKSIDCEGKITLDGYTVKKLYLIYWQDKKKETTVDVTAAAKADGSWKVALPVPLADTPYNVRCEAILESGGTTTPAYKTKMGTAKSSKEKL